MGSVIPLFGSTTPGRHLRESTRPPEARPRPPRGRIVGTCDLCRDPVQEDHAFLGEGRVTHHSCLFRPNIERGWTACRHFMYPRLAFPFAGALGTARVRPLIDQFLDDATHYALAFTLFSHLEKMLRESTTTEADRGEVERALAECKEQLRRCLRPPFPGSRRAVALDAASRFPK
jgi:hypothetical protein